MGKTNTKKESRIASGSANSVYDSQARMHATKTLRILLIAGALALTSLFASPVQAARKAAGIQKTGTFGLGAIIGDPTAITGKLNLSNIDAVDGGFSVNFDKWFLFYLDYLRHFPGALGSQNEFLARTTPYIGIGGVFVASNQSEAETRRQKYFSESSSSQVALGARVPLGLEWRPSTISVGVFVELVPGITIIPSTSGFFQGGIGARFFF